MMIETAKIEVIELEDDRGEVLLLAWGVHDPQVMRDACCDYYWVSARPTDYPVKHSRYVRLGNGRYEPVQGEPNATVITV